MENLERNVPTANGPSRQQRRQHYGANADGSENPPSESINARDKQQDYHDDHAPEDVDDQRQDNVLGDVIATVHAGT